MTQRAWRAGHTERLNITIIFLIIKDTKKVERQRCGCYIRHLFSIIVKHLRRRGRRKNESESEKSEKVKKMNERGHSIKKKRNGEPREKSVE